MSAADHGQWTDDLAAYALGALDPDETAAFERHLADCSRCQTELRWLDPAIDALPASVEQVPVPARLRKRILDTARAEAPALPSLRPQTERKRPWWRLERLRPAYAFAAVAVALLAGLAGGYALRGSDEPIATATIPIQAATPALQADAAVVRHGDSWKLDVSELPELHGGDVYQVWIAHDGRVRPSVLFVPSQGDHADVALPRTIASADQIMVTREPSGGSREPTSAPLLEGEL